MGIPPPVGTPPWLRPRRFRGGLDSSLPPLPAHTKLTAASQLQTSNIHQQREFLRTRTYDTSYSESYLVRTYHTYILCLFFVKKDAVLYYFKYIFMI